MQLGWSKVGVGLLAALTSCLLVLSAAAAAGLGQSNGPGKLSKRERELVAVAKAKGASTIVVMIAARAGAANTVASGIESLGGRVGYKDSQLDYVRARIAIDKVDAASKLDGVQALDVDELVPLPDPRPDAQGPVTPQTPPGPATPNNNPYMPIGDTGASQFMAANPTWDGRGVTIGIVDTGVSFDHPSLTTTSTGDAKIVNWVTGTDPVGDGDPTWLNMANEVNVAGGSFTSGGNTYSGVGADGTYRFAVFNEASLGIGSEYGPALGATCAGADLNRNGVCDQTFGVLWRVSDNKVWVDTNADKSFAGESAMTDFAVNRDQGWFGTDNAATPIAERVPFVVQTDGKLEYVNIGIVSGAHGSHVAGITSGSRLFGGAMSGAAPGAKIVSSRACLFVAGCTTHALTEGMIFVAKQSDVDVINMSIGGLPSLNAGQNARCTIYTRLIEQSNVQMFISAGNSGAGQNTVGDPSVCTDVMSVGSYITKESWQKNYGSDSAFVDNLHPFSSRGPREDGGFKPSFVAPGSAVSSTPVWQPGGPVAGTYALPPGYSMFNGTSMAAPEAAGAAALLIGAAKQAGVQKQPDQLRQAMVSSARLLDTSRIGVYEQGNGLINVGNAWNLLRTNIKTVEISSSVPVNTVISGFLATPNTGVGIHDREGVTGGSSYSRRYTFTRNSGGGGSITYNVSWAGNDGTFSSPGSIALGKGSPATLDVSVNPATAGVHSAILNLDDPSTTGIDYQTMNTVVAAENFTAAGNYAIQKSGTIGRNQSRSYFFRVPTGTPAFKVDLASPSGSFSNPGAGQVRFLRFHPFGVPIDSNSSLSCYNPPVSPGGSCSNPLSRTQSNPQAGVWEVTVEARRTSDTADAPFNLTASILGATVSPNPDVIASATIGVPVSRSYTLTNQFGAFTGRAVGTNLGSAFIPSPNPTIAHLAQQTYQLTIPAGGGTSLRATIGSPSDPAADLDLFVFRPNGTLAGQSADGDSEESVTIANPVAGTWTILVDGFSVPAGTTSYKYIDVFFKTPSFGTISITDANALRPSGSSWTVPGSVTAAEAPASGRVLYGNVEVRTDSNILVGLGDVIVQSVSP
jgi:Subtilase family/Bacterial pre-peptidase C-terminal domain